LRVVLVSVGVMAFPERRRSMTGLCAAWLA
jgi:hypothetical protein